MQSLEERCKQSILGSACSLYSMEAEHAVYRKHAVHQSIGGRHAVYRRQCIQSI